jgi:bifunctional isochorismate lyase/aryl carrier protein
MKIDYFTPATIAEKSLQFLDALPTRRSLAGSGFDPSHSALIVLDMQKYFLDPRSHAFVPSAAAILPGIKKLIGIFQERKQPVILTRHLNTPENAGEMSEWWADLIREHEPASELIPELDHLEATRIHKSQYDAFLNTDLKQHLSNLNTTQVVIAGVLTHLCCETTARSAFMHGFKVFFLVDGTATYYEDFHRAALLNLSHGFAVPVLTKDIEIAMGSGSA